jgi:hypothetical protein
MKWVRTARLVAVLVTGLVAASHQVVAQSVSPPIAEYREKAHSSFQLQNSSIFPITVVLEVRGFRITENGDVIDTALDTSRVHVKLSEMSFRVPPRGTRTVFYEATGDSLPAWFNILSAMTGAKTDNGLNVRILLPHVVYLNQKQPLKKDQVAIRSFLFDSAGKKARIQLENLGPNLGRVLQVSVGTAEKMGPAGAAFPLLPRSRRWTELSWEGQQLPTRLTLRFAHFSIDTLLTAAVQPTPRDSARLSQRP